MRGLSRFAFFGALAAMTVYTGCSVNPATGKRELMLVSESQELALGADADKSITAQMGLYDDPELQAYLQRIGEELAATSERPELDWQFKLVDDPLVNAFALPGGYIYITRGIMAHFDSEAQLASVVGHEIGHVTARHGAAQMSKQLLAQGLLVGGAILAPEETQRYGALFMGGSQLLFLKFGRDDENEADSLGLRYMTRDGYDARPMPDVFLTLKRVSEAAGARPLPNWQSTHPAPQDRYDRLNRAIAASPVEWEGRKVERESYLARLDGMVFGDDPRHGYFDGDEFFHPEMRFRLRFPADWRKQNQQAAVVAVSSEQDAMVQLSLSSEATAAAALDKFFQNEGIRRANAWRSTIGGMTAASAQFRTASGQNDVAGLIAYIDDGERIYQLVGYTGLNDWSRYESTISGALGSFARLTDRARIDVQPQRIDIVKPTRDTSPEDAVRRYNATVDAATLRLINQLDEGEPMRAGRSYKVVVGG